jgi:hypothetical protein
VRLVEKFIRTMRDKRMSVIKLFLLHGISFAEWALGEGIQLYSYPYFACTRLLPIALLLVSMLFLMDIFSI